MIEMRRESCGYVGISFVWIAVALQALIPCYCENEGRPMISASWGSGRFGIREQDACRGVEGIPLQRGVGAMGESGERHITIPGGVCETGGCMRGIRGGFGKRRKKGASGPGGGDGEVQELRRSMRYGGTEFDGQTQAEKVAEVRRPDGPTTSDIRHQGFTCTF